MTEALSMPPPEVHSQTSSGPILDSLLDISQALRQGSIEVGEHLLGLPSAPPLEVLQEVPKAEEAIQVLQEAPKVVVVAGTTGPAQGANAAPTTFCR